MSILAAFALPHPPILLAEVGHGEEQKLKQTADAYAEVGRRIAALSPDALVIASPHATLYADYFHLSPGTSAEGSLAAFHAPEVSLRVEYDVPLRKQIEQTARQHGLPVGITGEREPTLDHGTLIPLWLLRQAGVVSNVVRLGLSGLPPWTHYRVGQCIAEATNTLGLRTVFLASGDLSHKLKEDGPYGFAAEGPVFDALLTRAWASGDFEALLSTLPEMAEAAAECGLRSFQIMAGVLDKLAVQPSLLSYEGPFGVGYGIAAFTVTGTDESRAFGDRLEQARRDTLMALRTAEDAFVRLARESLEHYVREGTLPSLPSGLPTALQDERAGAFVSLKKDGQLRGCIGTIAPTQGCLALEIQHNAVAAAAHDPRFEPVAREELDDLVYSVDVLGEPESIPSAESLDPARFGVIVRCGSRSGLLLPALEGVDTPQQQLSIARRKAGIGATEPVNLFRFEVVRHY